MKYDIFISYSRDDKSLVHPFAEYINRSISRNCWIDLKGIESGAEFEDVIMRAIDECQVVLFMLSDNSLRSRWTKREVLYAESEGKRIIPILIDGDKLRGWFKFHFSNVDYIDIKSEEQKEKLVVNLKSWLTIDEESLAENKDDEDKEKKDDVEFKYDEDREKEDDNDKLYLAKGHGHETSDNNKIPDITHPTIVVENAKEMDVRMLEEWMEVKESRDIIKTKMFINSHPDSPFVREAKVQYSILKTKLLEDMHHNYYCFREITSLLDAGIISFDELYEKGLVSKESWNILCSNSNSDEEFPSTFAFVDSYQHLQSPSNYTDIYFFGTPSAGGKTCLLMALTGADGEGYIIDYSGNGGRYAANLSMQMKKRILPSSTYGSFNTLIHASIDTKLHSWRNKLLNVNFLEMSGEEYWHKIALNLDKTAFSEMCTRTTDLMMNDNKKIFFIHIDPQIGIIPTRRAVDIVDSEGGLVDRDCRKDYMSQDVIHKRFVQLLMNSENADIMKKVIAIHVIVTKADLLGSTEEERVSKAREILDRDYKALMMAVECCCEKYDINNSPSFLTFSLGKFYLGDIYDFDSRDTLKLIDIVRRDILEKKKGWIDIIVDKMRLT